MPYLLYATYCTPCTEILFPTCHKGGFQKQGSVDAAGRTTAPQLSPLKKLKMWATSLPISFWGTVEVYDTKNVCTHTYDHSYIYIYLYVCISVAT